MQTTVKKMLHNMLPIPLFISTAARNGEFNLHVVPQMSSGNGRRRSIKIVPEPLLTITANKKPTLLCYFTSTQIKSLINKDLSDERKAMWEKNLVWLTSRMVATTIFKLM